MKCPLCNLEMASVKNRMVFENDDTPDKQTKLFVEHDMSCRNKNCNNNGVVVTTFRQEVKM